MMNEILFYNEKYNYAKLTMNDPREIFNRIAMQNSLDILLETKNIIYSYDDIITIKINGLVDLDYINDIPHNLQELVIINSTLRNIIIPKECIYLHSIFISKSLLVNLPITQNLSSLIRLNINYTNITTIPLDYSFPPNIHYINLSYNKITNYHLENDNMIYDYTLFDIFPDNAEVLLIENYLVHHKRVYKNNIFIGKQKIIYDNKTYWYNPENPEYDNNNNLIYNLPFTNNKNTISYEIHKENAKKIIQDNEYRENKNIVKASSQNVHLTSICNSVEKNVNIIINLTPEYDKNKKDVYISEFITECKKKYYTELNKLIIKYGYVKALYLYLKGFDDDYNDQTYVNMINDNKLNSWLSCTDRYKQTGLTYGDVFSRIWLIVKDHPHRKYFVNNIKIELNQSVGYCWVGRFNRLINSLVGYVDGIIVGISIKEQLEIEIGRLIEKLNKNEITYEKCKEEFESLFSDENVKTDPDIKQDYINAMMDALEEYSH